MSIDEGSDGRPVRFGVFEVNPRTGELRKSGHKIKLQDQPFRVLGMLIKRRGEVVTREEIRSRLWNGNVHVDFDHGLNMAIKRIRAALGDSATNPRFIETLPKRGYRFIAPVDAPPANNGPDNRHLRQLALLVLAGALVLASVVGLAWRDGHSTPASSLTAVPLTAFPGEEVQPSFSPDGSQVAFSWNGENQDNFDIYVKSADSSDPQRLTSDPAQDAYPAWSRDGRLIAFVRTAGASSTVIVVPAAGGSERPLIRFNDTMRGGPEVGQPSISWLSDGKWLVIRGLKLVSVETGETRDLTTNTAGFDYAPAVSPDGRRIVFCRSVKSAASAELFLLALTADLRPKGEPKPLTSFDRISDGPAWSADGTVVVFSSGLLFGRRSLWRLPISDPGKVSRVSGLGEGGVWPAIPRQGNRMAYVQRSVYPNIWRVPMAGPNGESSPPELLIRSTRRDWKARYSPDGTQIVFMSNRTGQTAIWLADADGTNAKELYSKRGEHIGSPHWSPDGQRLAFDQTIDGQADIFVIDLAGRNPVRLTYHPASDTRPFCWSRDGRWIYFSSKRTGRREVWKVGATGEAPDQVTREGGFDPRTSPDGEFVYYRKGARGEEELWRQPVGGGEPERIRVSFSVRPFIVTDRGIYYRPSAQPDQPSRLRFFDLASGKEEALFLLPPWTYGSISPDGQWFVYSQVDDAGSDLMLVEDFQ